MDVYGGGQSGDISDGDDSEIAAMSPSRDVLCSDCVSPHLVTRYHLHHPGNRQIPVSGDSGGAEHRDICFHLAASATKSPRGSYLPFEKV